MQVICTTTPLRPHLRHPTNSISNSRLRLTSVQEEKGNSMAATDMVIAVASTMVDTTMGTMVGAISNTSTSMEVVI